MLLASEREAIVLVTLEQVSAGVEQQKKEKLKKKKHHFIPGQTRKGQDLSICPCEKDGAASSEAVAGNLASGRITQKAVCQASWLAKHKLFLWLTVS